jgi:hypothetical protein
MMTGGVSSMIDQGNRFAAIVINAAWEEGSER